MLQVTGGHTGALVGAAAEEIPQAAPPPQHCAEHGKLKGTAGRWNERGFGFIKPADGGEDLFCHVSGIQDGNMLREGDEV